MNEWERCANAIYHRVYDDDYLYGIYGSTVLFLFTHLHPYIAQRQEHNPRVYVKFCWLALRWRIRRDSENKVHTSEALLLARDKIAEHLQSSSK